MLGVLIDKEGTIHSITVTPNYQQTICGIHKSSGKFITNTVHTHMTRLCKICFAKIWEKYG